MSGKSPEDVSQLVDNEELNHDIQPHLGHLRVGSDVQSTDTPVALEYINPALDDRDENLPNPVTHTSDHQEGQNGTSKTGSVNSTNNEHCVASPPVYYSNRTGESVVVAEPVVIRQPNGVHVIRTQQCCELAPHRHVQERPLKIRHIKLLQAFSIVSIIIFFPLGIPAAYFAFKCEKEFHAGILRGEIDVARKLARRSERCLIFSVMAALLVAVAVFAAVEREMMKDDDEYWASRSNNAVLPAG